MEKFWKFFRMVFISTLLWILMNDLDKDNGIFP